VHRVTRHPLGQLLLAALVAITFISGCRELGFTNRVLWRLPAPDGKTFAVCQEIPEFDGPSFDIRLEGGDGSVVRRLYRIGDGDPCTEMAWSPDGQALAVLSGHVARVRVVDVAQVMRRSPDDTSRQFWPQFDSRHASCGSEKTCASSDRARSSSRRVPTICAKLSAAVES
jgi:hypothetical protein